MGQLAAAQAHFIDITTERNALKGGMDALRVEHDALLGQMPSGPSGVISHLQNDLRKARADVSSLQGRLQQSQTASSSLQGKLSTALLERNHFQAKLGAARVDKSGSEGLLTPAGSGCANPERSSARDTSAVVLGGEPGAKAVASAQQQQPDANHLEFPPGLGFDVARARQAAEQACQGSVTAQPREQHSGSRRGGPAARPRRENR